LGNRRAFVGINIGLHDIARHARRADPAIAHRLTFDRTFHDTAAHRLTIGKRQGAGTRPFHIALARDRIGDNLLAGREIRNVGVHRFSDAHCATLEQGNTSSSGRKLCDSQFERHRT
jgi:hypothetical protein